MRENYTLPRLYIADTLEVGVHIVLNKEQSHYLLNVLRLTSDDNVRVFNSDNGEWRAIIQTASKKSVTITIQQQLRRPCPAPDIWLCFAPVRKHRNAFILEKSTELGVSVLQPVITNRTQFPKIRLDKMHAQIIEAAEQTERLDIPDLRATQTLSAMLENWDHNRPILMGDEAGECEPALTVINNIAGPAALLIGPEGGFDPKERDVLRSLPFVKPVSLGPRILRADTAALSLLTLWQSICGDWKMGHSNKKGLENGS